MAHHLNQAVGHKRHVPLASLGPSSSGLFKGQHIPFRSRREGEGEREGESGSLFLLPFRFKKAAIFSWNDAFILANKYAAFGTCINAIRNQDLKGFIDHQPTNGGIGDD